MRKRTQRGLSSNKPCSSFADVETGRGLCPVVSYPLHGIKMAFPKSLLRLHVFICTAKLPKKSSLLHLFSQYLLSPISWEVLKLLGGRSVQGTHFCPHKLMETDISKKHMDT